MKKAKIIRRTVIVLLAILAVIYWKPLIHLAAWLLIGCWIWRFAVELLRFLAPLLIPLFLLYTLLH